MAMRARRPARGVPDPLRPCDRSGAGLVAPARRPRKRTPAACGWHATGRQRLPRRPRAALPCARWAPGLPPLLAAGNGFALFVAAHLETMRTKREPFARLAAKCTLTEILCGCGWEQERVARMLDLLDRLMLLPPPLDALYRQHIRNLKGKRMLTLMQRLRRDEIRRVLERGTSLGMRRGVRAGRAAGREEGRRALLVDLMQKRFGPLPEHAIARLQAASRGEVQRWTERFCDANSLDELLD